MSPMQLCDAIVSHAPLEDVVMHPLKIVLKDLHRLQDITRLYEAAHERNPKDPDTLLQLCASYIRCMLHASTPT